jgi:hypothetical protein
MRASILAFPALVTALITPYAGERSDALQNILKNTDNANKYKYPTDFTRGIIPVRPSILTTNRSRLT